mmetsp:Transcript_85839/g.277122  ORF Transcript_85839/g.277122 Transcript_85839/m.277122 type:complete len:335 (-) Transcript_85839:270-1274(-)
MAVLARSCYIADDVEEQQQPLVTAAPSADLGASGGLLRLRAAPAFAAGLLLCGLAAVALVASGVTMRGAAPAAPDLGLGSLQQLNHYGAEAVQDECDMDRVTSTVCEEGQLFKGGEWILAQCEASCVKLWKDMEANCSGNSKRALKGKRMLADCDDSDEVVPAAFGTSKAALKEGKKANVMCDKIMNKIESACKLSKEEVNFQKQIGDLCAEGCMTEMKKGKGFCDAEMDAAFTGGVDILMGTCSKCGSSLMSMSSSPPVNSKCEMKQSSLCNGSCHETACAISEHCDNDHPVPQLGPELLKQMLAQMGETMQNCSCTPKDETSGNTGNAKGKA